MSDGVERPRPRWWPAGRPLAVLGGLLALIVLVPPLSTLARRLEVVDAVQFAVLALWVPALVVLGAPWGTARAGARAAPGEARSASGAGAGRLERLADRRRRHPEFPRAAAFLIVDLVAIVAWRTPGAVDAVHRWPALVGVEAVVLVVTGVGLWLECVVSPPLVPRSTNPVRAVLATACMWTVWTVAYLQGMSSQPWYRGFHHVAGSGLSAAADRQLATVVLWAAAAVAWLPVIYANLVLWLRSEEDPDEELHHLLRVERRHGVATPGRLPPDATR